MVRGFNSYGMELVQGAPLFGFTWLKMLPKGLLERSTICLQLENLHT
jgi:hypothetical protein